MLVSELKSGDLIIDDAATLTVGKSIYAMIIATTIVNSGYVKITYISNYGVSHYYFNVGRELSDFFLRKL